MNKPELITGASRLRRGMISTLSVLALVAGVTTVAVVVAPAAEADTSSFAPGDAVWGDTLGDVYLLPAGSSTAVKQAASSVHNRFVGGAISPDGTSAYLSNQTPPAIFKLSPDGTTITQYIANDPNLTDPRGIAFDAQGRMYVVDANGKVVRVVPGDPSSDVIVASGLGGPTDVAFMPDGDMLVAESGFTEGTGGIMRYPAAGGPPIKYTSTQYLVPDAVVSDAAGNIYFTDAQAFHVWEIPADGSAPVSLPGPDSGLWGQGGQGPEGIGLDSAGNLYVNINGNSAGLGYVVKMAPDRTTNIINDTGFNSLRLDVYDPPPTFTADDPPTTGHSGTLYNYTFAALSPAGEVPASFRVASGSLPPGLGLDPTTGVLSGMPTVGGVWTFTVQAENAGSWTEGTAHTINVQGPATLSAAFGSSKAVSGVPTSLSFTVLNGNTSRSLSGVGFTVPLPDGLVVASPSGLTGSCDGGTITAADGSSSITLDGAAFDPTASCTFSVQVQATSSGTETVTTSPDSSVEFGDGPSATATLNVVPALTVSLATSGQTVIPVNGTTRLIATVTDPSTNPAATNVALTYTAPDELTVLTQAQAPTSSSTCGALTIAGSSVTTAPTTLASGKQCTVSFSVRGNALGVAHNTAILTSAGSPVSASTDLPVALPPTLSASFGSGSLVLSASTSLTFTVSNPDASASLTQAGFIATLPSGLVAVAGSTSATCGSLAYNTSTRALTASGAALPPGGSCTFAATVQGTSLGAKHVTTSTLSTHEGITGTARTASVTVVAQADDDFADATPLSGPLPITVTGSSVGATSEPGEPAIDGSTPNATVWWTWTANVSGPVTISTCGSGYDTALAAFTGSSVSGLTEVTPTSSDSCDGGSEITFDAVAGVTYSFDVDGASGVTGPIALEVTSPSLPTITWSPDTSLTYGAAVGSTDLSATAATTLPGTLTYSPAAGTVLPAGTHQAVTATFTPDDSADFSPVTSTEFVDVAPAAAEVTAASMSSVYGTAPLDVTASYSGLVNNDLFPATMPTCVNAASAASSVQAGGYVTSCSGAADPNYTFTYVDGIDTVTPAPAIVTASSQTSKYGTAPADVSASYSGLVNGDTAPATLPVCVSTATASSPVTANGYATNCMSAADPNYTFTYVPGLDTVEAALVTVTASSQSSVYGAAPAAVTPSYTGLRAGDTAPATPPACVSAATASSRVTANGYATYCLSAADPNYTFNYVDGVDTVTPAPATITASSQSSIYGSAPAVVQPLYSGLRNSDTAAATAPTCVNAAAKTSPVTAGGYVTSCNAAADPDYTFSYVTGVDLVAPAPITVTASSLSSRYGSTPGAVIASYAGLQNGDQGPATPAHCVSTATAASVVKAAGYPTTCSGAADGNYTFTYLPGTDTVTPAPLTIAAGSVSSTYGTAPVVLPTYTGLVNSDTAPATPPTCVSAATATTPVSGTGYVTSCSGAADPNYTITYVTGVDVVDPGSLIVTASSQSSVYGTVPAPVTASYVGLVNSDMAPKTLPTCVSTATKTSPVKSGGYVTSCSGAADPNYAITYVDGVDTVTLASVMVTASSQSSVYGTAPAAVSPTYSGLINGATHPATAPTCVNAATSTSAVKAGGYVTSCSGAADPDYTFTYVNGVDTVTPASATVTASSQSSVYGAVPAAVTASYAGLINGATAPATAPTCVSAASATSAVKAGGYVTSCSGAADPNYTFSYVPGVNLVTAAPVVVTASSASSVYGAVPAAVTAVYSGLKNGQSGPSVAPTCVSTASASSPVKAGGYVTSCSGAADPNYTFSYVTGVDLISPAALTITAASPSMVFGTTPPTITPSYAGLVNGDTSATALSTQPACSTTATSTSGVGAYPSSCQGAVSKGNYVITYRTGSVSVTAAPISIATPTVTVLASTSGVKFTATVTNAASGKPAAGVTVVFNALAGTRSVYGCTGVSNASGVATCTYSNVLAALLDGASTYTASGSGPNYQPATAKGTVVA